MARRLDIGISSYGAPELLRQTIDSVRRNSATDYRLLIVDNPKDGVYAGAPVAGMADAHYHPLPENRGYAGAVAMIQQLTSSEYIAYLDHDVVIQTPGWDEILCSFLDRHHEAGMVFPNGGAHPIDRGEYHEITWAPGFAWVLNRLCQSEVGLFDTALGHQEEADYCLRVRMAGWRCAALPSVRIDHLAVATNNPENMERIAAGVRKWVDKWAAHFGGRGVNYHSSNVLRWEDWGCNRLHLEEYFRLRLPDLNKDPETAVIDGVEYDLIKVPRLKGFYRGRII